MELLCIHKTHPMDLVLRIWIQVTLAHSIPARIVEHPPISRLPGSCFPSGFLSNILNNQFSSSVYMLHLLPCCCYSFHHHDGVLSQYHEASPLHLYNSVCVMCEHY
jgi:hypothetical protein